MEKVKELEDLIQKREGEYAKIKDFFGLDLPLTFLYYPVIVLLAILLTFWTVLFLLMPYVVPSPLFILEAN
jgi:hypothetical protein